MEKPFLEYDQKNMFAATRLSQLKSSDPKLFLQESPKSY